ncbi:glycerophosphoryl diester phosphodiesterase [Actinopolymorpha cephalotaxi]|uniref:Glycerophosphoryl diester phosphodiesterase n=1 Tax=Actinopolymorpha cephalotaxi TaxID=504797 RepID=A0A1I2V913_9ACTN|nr:glycerophosphodiester phosphodiesterase family protein [Actinopolymorpha cephalotaxi]NYH84793.1 glycerophosphoryl diester phosphodiesterase [Actinopolymorpha cephalotaxi]SFG85818.1 glycerophosphoryl diester phosphodiesterase [Actinopolymorpha cephalotaxi]
MRTPALSHDDHTDAGGRHETPPVLVVAHRGASGVAPENTVAAIRAAAREGADFAEVDVVLTRDGVPVLFHDNTLVRTTDATTVFPDRAPWQPGDFTLAELRRLDAGSWFADSFAGERIPTLAEALAAFDEYGIGLWAELKGANRHPDFVAAVTEVLRTIPGGWLTAPDRHRRFVATSFSFDPLAKFAAEIDHAVPLGGIVEAVPGDETLRQVGGWMDYFIPNFRRLRPGDLVRIRAAGMRPAFWCPNHPAAVASLAAQGATAVIQNYPGVARAVLDGQPAFPAQTVVVERVADGPADASAGTAGGGRYAVLRNLTGEPVDLGGWYVRDDPGVRLSIAPGVTIPARGTLEVHAAPGQDGSRDGAHDGARAARDGWQDGSARSAAQPSGPGFARGRNSVALHRPDGVVVDVAGDEPTA